MQKYTNFYHWLTRNTFELDAVVFDIDGVLRIGGRAAAGSDKLMDFLRAEKITFVLLTNDANHSVAEKAAFLQNGGLAVTDRDIISCGDALVDLAGDNGLSGQLFFIMGDLGKPCFAQAAGLATTRDPQELGACAGVIVGEENYNWEITINAVINYFIQHPHGIFIVPNPDEFYPKSQGRIHVAAGGVARLIRQVLKNYGIETSPIYLGKPFAPAFQKAHHHLEQCLGRTILRQRVLMLGDFLDSDIRGALDFGYRTALILTGVTTPARLAQSPIQPEFVFERL